MIRLTEITRVGNKIHCAAYLEDSSDPVKLIFSISEREFAPFAVPLGYEWCKAHISHARQFFEGLTDSEPPCEKVIMWY